MSKKNEKVKKLNKKHLSIDISVVAFVFILVAIVAGVINKMSKSTLTIYEVQAAEGLSQDNIVTGVIVREEEVISAPYSGYINYYTKDCVRVAKNSLLLSIDETGEIYEQLVNADISDELSDYDMDYLKSIIASYRDSSDLSDYSDVYTFSSDLENAVLELSGDYSEDRVDSLTVNGTPSTFHTVRADLSALISFNADELSGLKSEDVDESIFEQASSYKNYSRRKRLAAKGDTVAKLITSDTWQIMCEINESQLKAISGLKTVPVTICDDGLKLELPFEIVSRDGASYVIFTLTDYIQNYLNKRFLSVQLNWQISEGLKIPISSITEKTFYIVPVEFFKKGGDSNNLGLIKENIDSKTGEAKYDFTEATIYYNDGLYYYIDAADFTEGDVVLSPEGEKYTIGITEKLEGVYNINKGYAVFRRIERITQNKEYCIVKTGTSYGLSLYDHIALDASDAVDLGIIY